MPRPSGEFIVFITFWVGCPDRTLQSVIVKGYRRMHGDVILMKVCSNDIVMTRELLIAIYLHMYIRPTDCDNQCPPFLLKVSAPKHRSVWLSYLNFSIYATSV